MHSRIYQAVYRCWIHTYTGIYVQRHRGDISRNTRTRANRGRTRVRARRTCEYVPSYVCAALGQIYIYMYTLCTYARVCMCVHIAQVYVRYIPTRMYMHTLLRHVAVYGYTYNRWEKAKEEDEEEEEEEEKEEKRPKRQTCLASTRPEAHHRCLDLRISVDRRLMPRTRHTAREREREGGRQDG